MLEQIVSRLQSRNRQDAWAANQDSNYAGVLMPLVKRPGNPGVILTKRSELLNTHSGQVAFPGGKWDEGDVHLLQTALRETQEEIALPPSSVEVIAELPILPSLTDIQVRPYVGLVPPDLNYIPNPDEIEAVFEVPLSYLVNANNLKMQVLDTVYGDLEMPCYRYDGFIIWGFTLVVLVGFLNFTLDAGLHLEYPPETIRLRGEKPDQYELRI